MGGGVVKGGEDGDSERCGAFVEVKGRYVEKKSRRGEKDKIADKRSKKREVKR